jgi:hypothetical protein
LQLKPQLVPSQVAIASAGVGQGVHEAPQFAGLMFETHCPEQAWKPVLQTKPQLVPSQVAVALAGGEQGVHALPQLSMLVFDTHRPEQA